MTLPITPFGTKGVQLEFYKFAENITTKDYPFYQLGKLNYGFNKDGAYFVKIKDQTHLICVGETGSGKSNFMHHLLGSVFNTIRYFQTVTLVDLKGNELFRYKDRDRVDFIDDIETLKDKLIDLKNDMNQRFAELREKRYNDVIQLTYKYIFLDEIGTIGTYPNKKLKDEIFALLTELFQKGRAARIIFFIFAQKIDSTNIPSNVLANIPTKVLMKTDSDFNVNNTIGTKEDLKKITRLDPDSFPKGRAVVKNGHNSEKVLIQVPLVAA